MKISDKITKNCKAFTLVELIIAITIIGILAMVGAPKFTEFNQMNRLRTANKIVMSVIQTGRLNAINANRRAYVDFEAGSNSASDGFVTIWLDCDGDGSYDSGEIDSTGLSLPDTSRGLSGYKLPGGVTFGAAGPTLGPDGQAVAAGGVDFGGATKVGFNPRGEATSSGTVYLKGENDINMAISVSSLGRVRTWQWEDSQWQ